VNTSSSTQYVNASFPGDNGGVNFSTTGWVGWVRNSDGSFDHTATIYVICAPAGSVGKTSFAGTVGKVGTSAKAMKPE
jgi:hypothetical protein